MQTKQVRTAITVGFLLMFAAVVLLSLTRAGAQETPMASPAASPMASPGASPVSASTSVTLEMVDIAFNPTEFTVPANTDVTVTLMNSGAQGHNFSVTDHNQTAGLPNLGISVNVDAGQTGTATVNAPPGDYYFYCDVPGHEQAGMHGIMHVQ
jgi:uncharacterized cupredoxin-like copper-binding protein